MESVGVMPYFANAGYAYRSFTYAMLLILTMNLFGIQNKNVID